MYIKIENEVIVLYMQNDIHAKNKYIFNLVFKRLLFYFWLHRSIFGDRFWHNSFYDYII